MPFKNRRKPGKWVAKITHKGTQHWIGDDFSSKTEARRAEDAKRLELTAPSTPRGPITCDEFALTWTVEYPRPKASTNKHNAEQVRKFADEFQGVPMASIDRKTARAWAVRNRKRAEVVRAMFNDAVDDELIEKNPFSNLRLPQSRGRKDIDVLTPAEFDRLTDSALSTLGNYGPEFRALLIFAAHTGIRPGELVLVRWGDIDGDYLHINRRVDREGIIDTPKNGHVRTVTVPAPAKAVLRDVPHRHADTLFRTATGKRMNHSSLFYYWNQVRAAAGFPGLDFYETTRHLCATRLLEMGVSHADVAIQLGHRDGGALVMSTYGHPSEEAARQRLLEAYGPVAADNVVDLRSVAGE